MSKDAKGGDAMSSRKEVQIIPPARLSADAHRPNGYGFVPPPRVNPGGIIDSTLTRWKANRDRETINAVAERIRAETGLFGAQKQAVAAYIERQRALQELQELPEILVNDRECRRAERAERLRQHQHAFEMAELKRATEVAHSQSALLDAKQELKAQRDFGPMNYEIAWRKKQCEMLNVDLDAAERRALLDEVRRTKTRRTAALPSNADDLDDALYEARAELLANGLDTSRIDEVIERRKQRG
jgi:hypothetical protein